MEIQLHLNENLSLKPLSGLRSPLSSSIVSLAERLTIRNNNIKQEIISRDFLTIQRMQSSDFFSKMYIITYSAITGGSHSTKSGRK
jgi:hypothetical protein